MVMSSVQVLVASAVLTWAMIGTSAMLRTRSWTAEGRRINAGNRDNVPEPSPLAGRAHRASVNMLENMVLFLAVMLAVEMANAVGPQSTLGANIFFWARLVYWGVYLAGIAYLRTAVWFAGIVGLAIMIASLW